MIKVPDQIPEDAGKSAVRSLARNLRDAVAEILAKLENRPVPPPPTPKPANWSQTPPTRDHKWRINPTNEAFADDREGLSVLITKMTDEQHREFEQDNGTPVTTTIDG